MTTSANLIGTGIRIWCEERKEMVYLSSRYSLNFPAYKEPSASILDGKTKVAKTIFMLRVEGPSQNNIEGIYDKDIVEYKYKNQTLKGIVEYDERHATWVVGYGEKHIPYYKAKEKKVIGNTFENK